MAPSQTQASAGPAVVESYRDFDPPPHAKQDVLMLLRYVPQQYLVGLRTVLLTNQAALSRSEQHQKVWSRRKKIRLASAKGYYQAATTTSAAMICLLMDNLFKPEDRASRTWWFLRHEILAQILYHEIGHHIHRVHQPVYDGKENVAEQWARRLTHRFYKRRYWYLFPVLYPLAKLARLFRLDRLVKEPSAKA